MADKFKVLMIETGGWGGICHYTYNLANALSDSGIEDLIVISGRRYELEELERSFKLIKYFDSNKSYLTNISGLISILRKERPSVVHIQSILSPRKDWVLILLTKMLGIPVVYTVHNILPHEEEERGASGLRSAFSIIYKNSKRLIAHSESNKMELIREFGISPEKINVIPHGNYLFLVPSEAITKEEARKKIGLNESDKVILSFGAIRKYKGIDYLIRAFKKVVEEIPDSRLLIAGKPMTVGEDPVKDSYRDLIEKLGLKDKVILHPRYIPLSDIHEYFTASDVTVFPYLDTTESGSLQTALAFSKPVIATKVGSFEDAVEEGRNGFLIPPADEKALSEAILKILSLDEKNLNEMGNHSKFISEKRYDWEEIAKETLGVYKEVQNKDPSL